MSKKRLNYYYNLLHKSTKSFSCPHCSILTTPKAFEKHCSSKHDINPKTACVWCRQVSWSSGDKHHYADHLLNCFKTFVNPPQQPIDNSLVEAQLLSTEHTHPEKDFFDHEFAGCDDALHYESPLPLDPHPVQFRDYNLNLAASCVSKYLETQHTHDWFHVMVKSSAFESFATAMNENRDHCRTLPFSCWCDGGRHRQAEHRQHRHMIIVSHPKGYFQQRVWSRVECPEPPYPNFPCKRLKKIACPLHFVNSLGYMSNRKSRCDFSFKQNQKKASRKNHFYLYRTLPECYKLCLVLLWDEGIEKFFFQQYGQNVSIPKLVEGGPLTRVRKQWRQKLKDFYKLERGMILPVEKRFLPSREPTDAYLHLMNGSKLYFRSTEEDLDDDSWSNEQVRGGNCFYEAVQENMWIPRKRDQEILSYYKPLADKNKELENKTKELADKNKELEDKTKELADKNKELADKNKELESAMKESNREMKEMSERLETVLKELEALKKQFKESSKNESKKRKYTIIYSEEEI